MKTLYLSITVFALSMIAVIITLPTAQGSNGSAFFMKSNSTGKIYANFTFPILNNEIWNMNPEILTDMHDSNTFDSKDLTVMADPSSITANKSNVIVTYTITAKDNIKGVYALFLYHCGLSPLVIGLNESDVNSEIFKEFFTAIYFCPADLASTPQMNISGYSGIISKNISINSSNTNNANLVNQLGEIPSSPLKQFESGVRLADIKCRENFILITKQEDDSPACVTPNTAIALAERGWVKNHTGVDALGYPPVQLLNVTTSPEPIILGIPFYVNAIVVNHQTEPISYYGGCAYPLSASFDNIKTYTNSIHCLAISKNILGPNEQANIRSERIGTVYNATGPYTTATIKFRYEINGNQTYFFTSKQFLIQNTTVVNSAK